MPLAWSTVSTPTPVQRRRTLLRPPSHSPKPYLPPRAKVSTATPKKLLQRILDAGRDVKLRDRPCGRYIDHRSMLGHLWKEACEIHTDQLARDECINGLLKEALYVEWLMGVRKLETRVEADLRAERVLMHKKLMELKEQERLAAKERALQRRAEAAQHERDVRERRASVALLRQQTDPEAPPRQSRNPHGHVIHIARM